MFLTVHTAVASAIALKTNNLEIIIPSSLASHFILDALPHYKVDGFGNRKRFLKIALVDSFVALLSFIYIACTFPSKQLYLFIACFFSALPDIISLFPYAVFGKQIAEKFDKFHDKIQWLEQKWGILVEITVVILSIFFIMEIYY